MILCAKFYCKVFLAIWLYILQEDLSVILVFSNRPIVTEREIIFYILLFDYIFT